MSLNHTRRYRMKATFADGQSKTIAYKTRAAALRSADFEKRCGATKTEVWDQHLLDEEEGLR